VEGWRAEQQRQQTNAWSPGQKILNSTGARQPEHTFNQPVPIVARIVWADDGVEHIETVAAGPSLPVHRPFGSTPRTSSGASAVSTV
jgi:hypothetical protein